MTAALIGALIGLILIAFFVVPVAIAMSTINTDRREREKATEEYYAWRFPGVEPHHKRSPR